MPGSGRSIRRFVAAGCNLSSCQWLRAIEQRTDRDVAELGSVQKDVVVVHPIGYKLSDWLGTKEGCQYRGNVYSRQVVTEC